MDINKIILEKKKLLLENSTFQYVDGCFNLENFKPKPYEKVEIIGFSDDGSKLESKFDYITVGNEIKKTTQYTSFSLIIGNDDRYLLNVPNQNENSVLLNSITKRQLNFELLSIFSNIYNSFNPSKEICISKPFIIKFVERIPILILDGEFNIKELVLDMEQVASNGLKLLGYDAFSHLVYEASKKQLSISNIHSTQEIITNFQFHSNNDNNQDIEQRNELEEIYENNFDQGQIGINSFIKFHKCNQICKNIGVNIESNQPVALNNSGNKLFKLFGKSDSISSQSKKAIRLNEYLQINQNKFFEIEGLKSNEFFRVGKILEISISSFRSIEYFKMSASLGNLAAFNLLGYYYFHGKGCERDLQLSYGYYKTAADGGHAYSIFALGFFHANGGSENSNLLVRDPNRAIAYYEQAGDAGNDIGYYNIAFIYQYGLGDIKIDFVKSLVYYNKAAEMNNSDAYLNIGFLYSTGSGVKLDVTKAVQFYIKAGELGNSQACNNLGSIYKMGKGEIKKDLTKSIQYYQRSVDLLNPRGMKALADVYYNNGTTSKDDRKRAIQLYIRSAEHGNTEARSQLNLIGPE